MALLQLPKIFRSARSMDKSSSRRRRRGQQKRSSALAGVFFRQSAATVSISETDDTTVGSYSEGADDISESTNYHRHPQSVSTSTSSSSSSSSQVSWQSTTRKSFCKNQPLIAADPDSSKDFSSFPSDGEDNEPVVMLRQAMARELPESSWYYSSNHVMVNVERRKSMVAPLTRLATLDAMARQHAQAMADATELYHADPQQMIETFTTMTTNNNATATTTTSSTTSERSSMASTASSSSSSTTTTASTITPRIRIMGENVAVGDSIRAMHARMMQTATHRINILHRGYTHFGVGTAKGSDGRLYMCQVYRG